MAADASTSRVYYFNGEALLLKDFLREQTYHKGMRERLSADVLRSGVAAGMDVTWDARMPTLDSAFNAFMYLVPFAS